LPAVRRLSLVLASLLVAGGLAACGASKHTSTTGSTADAQAQIRSAYEQFFSPHTPLGDRVAVLQNGPKFKTVVASFASNPLAKNVNVKISSVKLENGDRARVVYTVKFGGTSLPTQTGTAVLQNGTWKVGFASLCRLVALGGSTPAACKS
jgi:hypothetical protein